MMYNSSEISSFKSLQKIQTPLHLCDHSFQISQSATAWTIQVNSLYHMKSCKVALSLYSM